MFQKTQALDHVRRRPVSFTFEGDRVRAFAGQSVAAALLEHGADALRLTPASRSPRAPYCMMGICFECLVTIDGMPNRQACMEPVREGMDVRRQMPLNMPFREDDQ